MKQLSMSIADSPCVPKSSSNNRSDAGCSHRIQRRRLTICLLAFSFALFIVSGNSWGQDDEPSFVIDPEGVRGYQESGMNLSEYENVNLANGNLTLNVPLATLATDGGLSYSVNAYYNSKVVGSKVVEGTHGEIKERHYRGVETYGAGWEMRPPRLRATVGCRVTDADPPSPLDYSSGCPDGSIEYWIHSYVTQSGAEHRLISVPPNNWEALKDPPDHSGKFPFEGPPYDYYVEDLPTDPEPAIDPVLEPPTTCMTSGPGRNTNCPCVIRDATELLEGSLPNKQVCYTWEPPFLRVTIDGQAKTAIVEDESGTISRFNRFVDSRALEGCPGDLPGTCGPIDFREDVDGFYVTSIERGPGVFPSAQNTISFDYDTTSIVGDDCTGNSGEPWMVQSITASGATQRRVDLCYDNYSINGVDRPVLKAMEFPAVGGAATEVLFGYKTVQAPPAPYTDEFAPFLTSVSIDPDGDSELVWTLDTTPSDVIDPIVNEVRVRSLTLPTGAVVDYDYQLLPVVDSCAIGPQEFSVEEAHSSGGSLYRRILRSNDASGSPRVETTAMTRYVNCNQSDGFEDLPYPTNGFFKETLPFGIPYFWTRIETYAGDALPHEMQTSSTMAVHRFDYRGYKEFSSDLFSTIPGGDEPDRSAVRGLYSNCPPYEGRTTLTLYGTPETYLQQLSGVDVLRHTQVERSSHYETGDFCCPLIWDFWENRIDVTRTITNETLNDIRLCDGFGSSSTKEICREVTTEHDYNPYLKPIRQQTTVSNDPNDFNESRYTDYSYDDPYFLQYPGSTIWDLGKRTRTETGEALGYLPEVVDSYWENGSGYRRLKKQWINAESGGVNGSCGETARDCVETNYWYDNNGNVEEVQKAGGYREGFGEAVPAEKTLYEHGVPAKKTLESTSGLLLTLWERGIDPGTGLIRWQVDGSGVGRAYDYDALGRMTDVVPIEGTRSGDSWSLKLQPYESDGQGNGTAFINGSHFEYSMPNDPEAGLAWRSVSDASYTVSTGGDVTVGILGTERAKLYLDGMGRPTQLTEFYLGDPQDDDPLRTNERSRFSLGYFHDNTDGSSLNPCGFTLSDPEDDTTTRVVRSSEWIDGAAWPGCSATSLKWTSTEFDSLNRSRLHILPDGSEVSTQYLGDGTVLTTREVATAISGLDTPFTTTSVSDAFGRLRRLEEEIESGLTIESRFRYDATDRLREAHLDDGSTTPQSHSYLYSSGGFLQWSIEPERYTQFASYDALGNLLWENTRSESGQVDGRSIDTRVKFDDFGRLMWKRAGPSDPSGELDELATFGYGGTFGSPDYNKLVSTSQRNLFKDLSNPDEPLSATVRHEWTYGSPGGRIINRTTSVTGNGIGSAGDGFFLEYAYDQWGNRSYIAHPSWTPWMGEDVCPSDPFVEQLYTYDGSWLKSAALAKDLELTAFASVGLKHHPNGRTAESKMYAGTVNVATQSELMDDDAMARPKSMSFSVDGSTPWAQTNYSYDGSGNITSFGITGATASGPRAFTYDGLNRLTGFFVNGTEEEYYSYDAFGNMENFDGFSMPTDHTTNRIESVGGITIPDMPNDDDSAWDARGNLRWIPAVPALGQREKTLMYSAEDRLMESVDTASAGSMWRYAYDTSGERVVSWRKDADGNTQDVRIAVRDEGGAVLSDWLINPNTNPTSFSRQRGYLYAGGRMVAQVDWTEEPVRRFVAVDHLGSTRYLLPVDSAGNVGTGEFLEFFPFGGFFEGGPTSDTTHLFTGHERDFGLELSELDYMHARYYSPNFGRFVSVDPIGGTVGSSQSWNRYSYVLNNPVNMVDPTGRIAIADDVLIGGAIVATSATIAYLQAPSPGDPNKTNAQALADSSLELLDTTLDAMDSMDEGITDFIYDAFFAEGDSAYAADSAKEITPDRNKANDEAGRARDRDRENKQREKERKRFGPKDSTPGDRNADSLPEGAPGENTDIDGNTHSPGEDDIPPHPQAS